MKVKIKNTAVKIAKKLTVIIVCETFVIDGKWLIYYCINNVKNFDNYMMFFSSLRNIIQTHKILIIFYRFNQTSQTIDCVALEFGKLVHLEFCPQNFDPQFIRNTSHFAAFQRENSGPIILFWELYISGFIFIKVCYWYFCIINLCNNNTYFLFYSFNKQFFKQ